MVQKLRAGGRPLKWALWTAGVMAVVGVAGFLAAPPLVKSIAETKIGELLHRLRARRRDAGQQLVHPLLARRAVVKFVRIACVAYCSAEVRRARLSSTVDRNGCVCHSSRVSSMLSSRY